jgi:hypothetical protein
MMKQAQAAAKQEIAKATERREYWLQLGAEGRPMLHIASAQLDNALRNWDLLNDIEQSVAP